jgi:hypothetical protein
MRIVLAAALAATLLPLDAHAETAATAIPPGAVVVVSPATGDLAGYRIVVAPSGDAVADDGAGEGKRVLSAVIVKALFEDVAAAMPLSKLQTACTQPPKSPTPLVVTYRGETSPDITCAADSKGLALYADVQTVARSLYVANYRARSVTIHGNGQATDTSQPAAQPQPAPAMPANPSSGY